MTRKNIILGGISIALGYLIYDKLQQKKNIREGTTALASLQGQVFDRNIKHTPLNNLAFKNAFKSMPNRLVWNKKNLKEPKQLIVK